MAATEAALPLLRDVAVSKANVQLRCLSYEALDQARRLPIDALRARATTLLDGVAVDCDPARGAAPAAGAGAGGSTGTMTPRGAGAAHRAARQPAGRSWRRRTSSALLAAGAEVEPLLQKRLQQTDRCRGLALVAGILASRNAAAADVEAAFTRVLEGKCDGREPFDLLLAQGVAAAFMTRPDGIAKMTRLLVHRDVSVRRRAAEAFGTLFERLGSGEHAQPAAVDPALLAAGPRGARAARRVRDDRARSAGALPGRAGAHARATGGARCAASRRRGGDRRPHAPLPGAAESLTA